VAALCVASDDLFSLIFSLLGSTYHFLNTLFITYCLYLLLKIIIYLFLNVHIYYLFFNEKKKKLTATNHT